MDVNIIHGWYRFNILRHLIEYIVHIITIYINSYKVIYQSIAFLTLPYSHLLSNKIYFCFVFSSYICKSNDNNYE